jgi:hypothetical protein
MLHNSGYYFFHKYFPCRAAAGYSVLDYCRFPVDFHTSTAWFRFSLYTSKDVFMRRESWASFACMLIVDVGQLQFTTSASAAVPQPWWWWRHPQLHPQAGELLGFPSSFTCSVVPQPWSRCLCLPIKPLNFKEVLLLIWYWNVLFVV